MKYIFIASPYIIGDRQTNVFRALDAANELMDIGFTPYCPLLCHFWQLYRPRDEKQWRGYSLDWLKKCDALLRLPGESEGADREVAEADRLQMPVFLSIPLLLRHVRGAK